MEGLGLCPDAPRGHGRVGAWETVLTRTKKGSGPGCGADGRMGASRLGTPLCPLQLSPGSPDEPFRTLSRTLPTVGPAADTLLIPRRSGQFPALISLCPSRVLGAQRQAEDMGSRGKGQVRPWEASEMALHTSEPQMAAVPRARPGRRPGPFTAQLMGSPRPPRGRLRTHIPARERNPGIMHVYPPHISPERDVFILEPSPGKEEEIFSQ